MRGRVKWFNIKRGYGFIVSEDNNDYFFHYSEIIRRNFKTIDENQEVEFDTVQNSKRNVAINIKSV